MRKTQTPARKRPFNIELGKVRVEFASDDAAPVMVPAFAYIAVRVVARVLTAIVPMSAMMALVTTLLWFAAALFLFIIVTWQRDDNWLAAGMLIGATFLGGGVLAETVGRVLAPGTFVDAMLAVGGASLQMLLRALLLVPVAGGFVAGARWLTTEVSRSDALNS
jgi:hypothetical protein